MAAPLSHLSDDDRELAFALLRRVVEQSDDYINQVAHLSGDGLVTYFVRARNGQRPHGERITHHSNIAPLLESLGLVVQAPPPSPRTNRRTGAVKMRQSEQFQFTPLALESFKKLSNVDDAEVRRRIGVFLYERYQESGEEFFEWDGEAVARATKVARKRVVAQTRLMRDIGLLNEGGPNNSALEFGYISFSKPDGLRWAMSGFPSDFSVMQSRVEVDVHINVHHFLATIDALPINSAEKAEAEELAKDIEREPTVEKFGRLLEMAANIKELIVPAGQLIAQHADKIPHLS